MNTDVLRVMCVAGHDVPIYGTKEEPLFLAVDVARMIDYSVGRTNEMTSRVDADEKVLLNTRCSISGNTHGNAVSISKGNPNKWFLTEDGLYEVLMQSRKPIARQFKRAIKDILKELRLSGKADFEDWFNYNDPLVDEWKWEAESKRQENSDCEEFTWEEFLISKGYTDDMLSND